MKVQRYSILCVHGLANKACERELYDILKDFNVFSIKIPKDPISSEAFGYGFITFKDVYEGKVNFNYWYLSL